MIPVELQYNPRLTPTEKVVLALPNKLRNMRIIMQTQLAPAMNRMLRKHWDSKGAAFGFPWAPWAPATLRKRLRKGNVAKGILRDSDHLFTTIFQDRPTDNRLRVSNGQLTLFFNTKVPYAVFHQVGTRFMPERLVFPDPIPDSFKREARGILRKWLTSPED